MTVLTGRAFVQAVVGRRHISRRRSTGSLADGLRFALYGRMSTSEFSVWPAALTDLVSSACANSPAWTTVRHLAAAARDTALGQPLGATRAHNVGEVAAVLDALLSGHTPRRSPIGTLPTSLGRGLLIVDPELRGPDGRLDPMMLAPRSHGAAATRRPAQEQMTTALHGWADDGVPALVEAPTGTGKSFAILAAALDWLSGAPADKRRGDLVRPQFGRTPAAVRTSPTSVFRTTSTRVAAAAIGATLTTAVAVRTDFPRPLPGRAGQLGRQMDELRQSLLAGWGFARVVAVADVVSLPRPPPQW